MALALATEKSAHCRRQAHSLCDDNKGACSCPCHAKEAKSRRPRVEPVVNLRWEEPPAPKPKGGTPLHIKLAEPLKELEENPGKWARLVDYCSASGAVAAARKLTEQYDSNKWEFRGSRVDDGSALFARRLAPGSRR